MCWSIHSHPLGLSVVSIGDFSSPPDYVCYPLTERHIMLVLRFCSSHRICVVPYGGGSSVVGGVEHTHTHTRTYNGIILFFKSLSVCLRVCVCVCVSRSCAHKRLDAHSSKNISLSLSHAHPHTHTHTHITCTHTYINMPGSLTIDMKHFNRILSCDHQSHIVCAEAGTYGPHLERQLRSYGYTLRHYPQSFEFSTLGGWIATRAGGMCVSCVCVFRVCVCIHLCAMCVSVHMCVNARSLYVQRKYFRHKLNMRTVYVSRSLRHGSHAHRRLCSSCSNCDSKRCYRHTQSTRLWCRSRSQTVRVYVCVCMCPCVCVCVCVSDITDTE